MSTLSAARADNFYFPKDFDPSVHKSIHHYNKVKKEEKHGARNFGVPKNTTSNPKDDDGTSKVRFETPFHVRCEICKQQIAKGVRFNANKKCVGKFHTTKIWEFTMNCKCGNKVKCRTDPETTDYKYVQGAIRIFQTENATDGVVIDMKLEAEMKKNPFLKLDNMNIHNYEDKGKFKTDGNRIHLLQEVYKARDNHYEMNSMLRKKFRTDKKN